MAKKPKLTKTITKTNKKVEQKQKQTQTQNNQQKLLKTEKEKENSKDNKQTTTTTNITKSRLVPFAKNDKILFVGEANFSFALSVATNYISPDVTFHIFATSYDSEKVCNEKYPDAAQNVENLKQLGAKVLFNVDAQSLEKSKVLKGQKFDRIVFNFPHVGAGEKDQDRNVRLNQTLILRFLRSCRPFLKSDNQAFGGGFDKQFRKRKRNENKDSDDDEDSDEDDYDGVSELDYDSLDELDLDLGSQETKIHEESKTKTKEPPASSTPTSNNNNSRSKIPRKPGPNGTVLITLRTDKPYSLWDVPTLAKKGRQMASLILPHPANREAHLQPVFETFRSFAFDPRLYPGYAHRRTIGYQAGISTDNCEDVLFAAKSRKQGDTNKNSNIPRTYEFVPVAKKP